MLKQVKDDPLAVESMKGSVSVLTILSCLGEIINWVALDREHHSQHSLRVMVSDQGRPRLNATATVHILVTDINDNAPQFTHLPASKELNVQVSLLRFASVCCPARSWNITEAVL